MESACETKENIVRKVATSNLSFFPLKCCFLKHILPEIVVEIRAGVVIGLKTGSCHKRLGHNELRANPKCRTILDSIDGSTAYYCGYDYRKDGVHQKSTWYESPRVFTV